MAGVEVRINEQQWAELEHELASVPRDIPRAALAAVNRTGRTGATRIRRRIAGIAGIGVRKLGNRVKWLWASADKPHGKIRLAEYNLRAIDTPVTPTLGGMFALAKIAAPIAMPNTPFKQTMKSGHLGWFVRIGAPRIMQSGRYVGKRRQPIQQVHVPGAATIWQQSPSIAAEELSQLQGVLRKNLLSQIDRFLNRPKGAA